MDGFGGITQGYGAFQPIMVDTVDDITYNRNVMQLLAFPDPYMQRMVDGGYSLRAKYPGSAA
jgi:hypothetical protein